MSSQYETLFYLLTTFFFVISVVKNSISWLSIWQQKNFNFKRVLVYLLETKEGRSVLIGWENILKWMLIVYFFATIFYGYLLDYFPYLVFAVYFISAGVFIWRLVNREITVPVITLKTVFLALVTILIVALLYFIPLLDKYLWLIFLDKLATLLLWFGIFILLIFSDLAQDITINKAIKKRSMFKDLIVIGIAGSYGKSEIKGLLSLVLSHSFSVLKTKPHQYSSDAIAHRILQNLSAKRQVFIVDLNPYQSGQMALLTQVIQPTIGILTAINEHYFALFGSEEKIMAENYGLIDSLPQNGLAILDVSNRAMYKLLRRTRKKKISFATDNSSYRSVDIRGTDIVLKKFSVSFSVYKKDVMTGRYKVRLLGKQVIDALLPVIYLAQYLGMKPSEIKKALSSVRPLPHIMQPFRSEKKVILIDDTYHSNPATIADAVEYLRIQKGTKVFVLQPMVELGRKAKPDHVKVARLIASVCDYLIVTNSNYFDQMKEGVDSANSYCQLLKLSPRKTADFIKQYLKANDMVIFEGKEAYSSLRLIPKESVLTS